LQQQDPQQYTQGSMQMPSNTSHGGHELLDSHETVGGVIGGLEQYVIFSEHIQDQELKSIAQNHRSFLTQMYNTIVDTLTSGRDPAVPTQRYQMSQSNEVIYGMQPSSPKAPFQSVNEITDECISSYMLGILKQLSAGFTTTALEATNPVLRRVYADSIPNLIEMAYELFLYQNKHQYYQVPQLAMQDMQTLANSFAPSQGTMPH